MRLGDKLASIPRDNIINELDEMLNHAHVSINWYAQRIVSVDEYEGSVTINELANTYLRASTFQQEGNPSLQERLNCYALWGRVQKLYKDSSDELKQTWLFKYLTPVIEFKPYCRACAGDPMAIIGEWEFGSRKNSLFQFSPEEFKKMWPETKAIGKSWTMRKDTCLEKWSATKEMVEKVLANQERSISTDH